MTRYITDEWTYVDSKSESASVKGQKIIWLRHNFGESAKWENVSVGEDEGKNWISDRGQFFWFRNKRDATLFLIRWN